MASKKWSVAVTDLAGATHLHSLAVEADNWMSALRSGRSRIGEEGGVPQGASCAVSPDGVVTILDPVSRRKFVLTQQTPAEGSLAPAAPSQPIAAAHVAPVASAPAVAAPATSASTAPAHEATQAAPGADPTTGKRKKFQTVAFEPSMMTPPAKPAEAPRSQKFQTVAFDASSHAAPPSNAPAAEPAPKPRSIPPNPFAPAGAAPSRVSAPPAPAVPAQAFPAAPLAPTPFGEEPGTASKKRKFQTVAFDASSMGLQQPRAAQPAPVAVANVPPAPAVAAPTAAAPAPIAPVVTAPMPSPSAAPVAQAPSPSIPVPIRASAAPAPVAVAPAPAAARPSTPAASHQVQLLHQRSEDPTPKNPLTYRERSFVVIAPTTPAGAEAILRTELARIKEELSAAKRGKFVNLALFDHRWQDRPQRPPIAALQWKDWKGDPEITFPPQPAQAQQAQPVAAASSAHDDRLATAFEALQDLPFLKTAAEGLEFAVKLLSDTIASQAIAASLYDINTDELRIVAALGPGAQERKTMAIPVAIGLFGQAARGGDKALVIANVLDEPEFDPGLDAAPGVDARNMLLRPLVQDGQLFGVLQLTNRVGHSTYSNEDVNLINYIAERVAGFVRQSRLGGR